MLAMLHVLAAEKSRHPVWWLYGARNREEHPFREESRALLQKLPDAHSYIQYSRPVPADKKGVDFDAPGRLTVSIIFADNFGFHTPQPGSTPDKAGVRKLYTHLRVALPNFHAEIHWQLADGERMHRASSAAS